MFYIPQGSSQANVCEDSGRTSLGGSKPDIHIPAMGNEVSLRASSKDATKGKDEYGIGIFTRLKRSREPRAEIATVCPAMLLSITLQGLPNYRTCRRCHLYGSPRAEG